MAEAAKIEINGKSYVVETLSPDVLRYVAMYRDWGRRLRVAEAEKNEADVNSLRLALGVLIVEIETRIKRGIIPSI